MNEDQSLSHERQLWADELFCTGMPQLIISDFVPRLAKEYHLTTTNNIDYSLIQKWNIDRAHIFVVDIKVAFINYKDRLNRKNSFGILFL